MTTIILKCEKCGRKVGKIEFQRELTKEEQAEIEAAHRSLCDEHSDSNN